jgi:hypothetical protein
VLRIVVAFLLLWLMAACSPEAAPSLALHVQALTGGLPKDVAKIRLHIRIGDEAEQQREATLAELETDQGKRRLAIEHIQAGVPITVDIEALKKDGSLGYAGVVGPVRLGESEHVKAQVTLFTRATSELVPGTQPPGRFLHTQTTLDDGRVLIAGGFGAPSKVSCPASVPAKSTCFAADALSDAWLFDASRAQFTQVSDGMLEARGGHSATRLPGGRVLLAGGASSLLLVLYDDHGVTMPALLGVAINGASVTLASFELFDANPTRVADQRAPGHGQFVGPAGAGGEPGPLERTRFLHAASASPRNPARVLLAGGSDPSSATTYELFDAQRTGGPGIVHGSVANLGSPRSEPTALALHDGSASWVWIFGGASATSNDDLAERWQDSAHGPAGSIEPATRSAFPHATSVDRSPMPGFAWQRPLATTLAQGTHAFVTGGLGVRCTRAGAPSLANRDDVPCTSAELLRQGFWVDAGDGSTSPVSLPSPHIFGAAAELPSGSALLTGGATDVALTPGNAAHVLTLASSLNVSALALQKARILHATSAFGRGGTLSTGGLAREGAAFVLVSESEVLWP